MIADALIGIADSQILQSFVSKLQDPALKIFYEDLFWIIRLDNDDASSLSKRIKYDSLNKTHYIDPNNYTISYVFKVQDRTGHILDTPLSAEIIYKNGIILSVKIHNLDNSLEM